jgi:hypothetical protein
MQKWLWLAILTLPCEYMLSLLLFIVNSQEHFQTNSPVHSVNTRNKNQLHRTIANISCFQKSAFYAGIKISSLPSSDTSLIHKKEQFKVALKRYLITHSFYSVDEFVVFTNNQIHCIVHWCWGTEYDIKHLVTSVV